MLEMLKLIRNTLAEKSLLVDNSGNEINWQYLQELHCESKNGPLSFLL